MKTAALFLDWPQLALELLNLPYSSDSYRFVSEEIKQTGFRIDGLFKPADDTEYPLIFAEVQYQPDSEFYGRFFSEIALYLIDKNQHELGWPWWFTLAGISKSQPA